MPCFRIRQERLLIGLTELTLNNSILVGADLRGASITLNLSLDGADLTGADLTGADLTGANLPVNISTNGAILKCVGHTICNP